jgi:hypothetical protein
MIRKLIRLLKRPRRMHPTLRAVRFATLLAVFVMIAASVPVEPGIAALPQQLLAGGMACFLALFFSL